MAIEDGNKYVGIHIGKHLFYQPYWGFLFFVGTWRGNIVWLRLNENPGGINVIRHCPGVLGVNVNSIVSCIDFSIRGDLFVMSYWNNETIGIIEVDLSTSSVVTGFPRGFVPPPTNSIPWVWNILTGGEFNKTGQLYFLAVCRTKMKC